jgi:hypothetical protein
LIERRSLGARIGRKGESIAQEATEDLGGCRKLLPRTQLAWVRETSENGLAFSVKLAPGGRRSVLGPLSAACSSGVDRARAFAPSPLWKALAPGKPRSLPPCPSSDVFPLRVILAARPTLSPSRVSPQQPRSSLCVLRGLCAMLSPSVILAPSRGVSASSSLTNR